MIDIVEDAIEKAIRFIGRICSHCIVTRLLVIPFLVIACIIIGIARATVSAVTEFCGELFDQSFWCEIKRYAKDGMR